MHDDFPATAFLSFAELTDPSKHQAYNEYHHLDHRPANLALPFIHWGERFVRTPRCTSVSHVGDPWWGRVHYINHYLFRDAGPEAKQVFGDLGSLAIYWGRRPDQEWSERVFGFYKVLKGYAAPRVRVAPSVVPMRPNLGIHITLTELRGEPKDLEEMGLWYDTVRLPDLLALDGVAGGFTAVTEDGFPVERVAVASEGARPMMAVVLYLDTDPVVFAEDLAAHEGAWSAAGRVRDNSATERLLLSSPCEAIRPFEYGWFDEP